MGYELAQVNVARLRAPLNSPELAGFLAVVDPVVRLADAAPGLVWRCPGTHGADVVVRPDGDGSAVVHVSVWASYPKLHAFTYRLAVLRRYGPSPRAFSLRRRFEPPNA